MVLTWPVQKPGVEHDDAAAADHDDICDGVELLS